MKKQKNLDPNQMVTIPAQTVVGIMDLLSEVVRDNMEISFPQARTYLNEEGEEVVNPTLEELAGLNVNIDVDTLFNTAPSYSYNVLGMEAEKLGYYLSNLLDSQTKPAVEEEESTTH